MFLRSDSSEWTVAENAGARHLCKSTAGGRALIPKSAFGWPSLLSRGTREERFLDCAGRRVRRSERGRRKSACSARNDNIARVAAGGGGRGEGWGIEDVFKKASGGGKLAVLR